MKKILVLVSMCLCVVLSTYKTYSYYIKKPVIYKNLLKEAKNYEDNSIYIYAIDKYKEALNYKDNKDTHIKIAKDYLKLGDYKAYIEKLNYINDKYNYPVDISIELAKYYIDKNKIVEAIDILKEAIKNNKKDESLLKLYEDIRYTYSYINEHFDYIGEFANNSAIARYTVDDNTVNCIIDTNAKEYLATDDDFINIYSDDKKYMEIKDAGKYYYIDKRKYKIYTPKEKDVEYISPFNEGYAYIKANGKYAYIDSSFNKVSEYIYDDVTLISGGFGAVKQNGKWAIIDKNMKLKTKFIYDDVIKDENAYFCKFNRMIVGENNKYYILNEKLKKITDTGFDLTKTYRQKQALAVKIGNLWGFVDYDGKELIKAKYEDADSFSNNLAPIKENNKYYYIDKNGKSIIDDDFTFARSFYKGVAVVSKDDEYKIIQLEDR